MISSSHLNPIGNLLLCGLLLTIAGCAALGGDTAAPAPQALSLRNLQIETVDGERAVLLRLSRLPGRVIHSSTSSPASITVRVSGPRGEGDFAEQVLPQTDPQIARVRVGREGGELRVILDLKSDMPPSYSVHEMADWIMIRLGGPRVEG